jgi:hypothetical protein
MLQKSATTPRCVLRGFPPSLTLPRERGRVREGGKHLSMRRLEIAENIAFS